MAEARSYIWRTCYPGVINAQLPINGASWESPKKPVADKPTSRDLATRQSILASLRRRSGPWKPARTASSGRAESPATPRAANEKQSRERDHPITCDKDRPAQRCHNQSVHIVPHMERPEQDTVKNREYHHERRKGQPMPVAPKKCRLLVQTGVVVPVFKRCDLVWVLHRDSRQPRTQQV